MGDPNNPKLPPLGQIPLRYFTGADHITDYVLARLLNRLGQLIGGSGGSGGSGGGILALGLARGWTFQTNTAIDYAGGFYEHAASDDAFSPSISFGAVNVIHAAHVFVVTSAVTVDELTIRVTGTSVNDNGLRVPGDTDDIVIPAGTPANSYFEAKKFNGQVVIEAVSGTPVACNYGWSKYHDANNQDFVLVGLEAIWNSDSTDSTSDIELIHHRATGWTFNPGASATPPAPLVSRSVDFGAENEHQVGMATWKRANLSQVVRGSQSEGVLFRVTSGSTGIGSLSFRRLNIELTLRPLLLA
jgi:hypothetical protein